MRITNFASGELGPNLKGRTDLGQYYQSALRLENFNVIATGGIERRCGMKRCGMLHGECRLIPFILDRETSYILELVPGAMFFWLNGSKQTGDAGEDLQLGIPYESLAELREIQYAQDFDTLIFVQRDHAPLILKYDFATQSFTLSEMNFDFWPAVFLDDDHGYIKIADPEGLPSGSEGEWCIYNGHLYHYADGVWNIDGDDPEEHDNLFTAPRHHPGAVAFFNSRLFFASSYSGRQKIWASAAPDTKGTRYNDFSTYRKYVTVSKVIREPDLHMFTGDMAMDRDGVITITNMSQDLLKVLKNSPERYYIINPKKFPAGTKVKSLDGLVLTVDGGLVQGADIENRVVFYVCMWQDTEAASADDYEMKVVSNNIVTDDCSFYFEVASDQNDSIRWLSSGKFLAIGTESSIWATGSSVTANSISCELAARYGTDDLQAHPVATATIFFAQGKCGIREYYYDSNSASFQTNNIAILNERILTESPACDFDFMQNPYNRIIVTREDGIAASLLYDKTNGVFAWSRTVHGSGDIRSCAVVRGYSWTDIPYFAVKSKDGWTLEELDETCGVYLDSWQRITDPAQIDEYDAASVTVWDAEHESFVRPEDLEEILEKSGAVYVGYRYDSVVCSMPVLSSDWKKRITGLIVRFEESYFPLLKVDGLPDEEFCGAEEPYSGVKKITFPGITDYDVTFTMSCDKPSPCMILAVDAETT